MRAKGKNEMKKVKKAIIPVAGYGSRILPFTKAVPKPMVPILNKPSVQYIVEEAVQSGIEEVFLVVGQHKEIIEAHFSHAEELENMLAEKGKTQFLESVLAPVNLCKIHYIVQEKQLGTGHAVLVAKDFIGDDEPFAVMFGDDVMAGGEKPVLKQLIETYEKENKTVIGVENVGFETVCKYASVEFDKNDGREYFATKITEKPAPGTAKSDLSPTGRYVLREGFFDVLEHITRAGSGEYQLTDALDLEIQKRGLIAYRYDGVHYDMGNVFGILQANVEYGLKNDETSEKVREYIKQLAAKL